MTPTRSALVFFSLLTACAGESTGPAFPPAAPVLHPSEGVDPAAWDADRAEEVLDATWYGDFLISNSALVLDDKPEILGWQRLAQGAVRLDFDSADSAAAMRRDAVLVSGKGGGYLRRVVGVEQDGASIFAQTEPAVLTDVLFTGRVFERTPVLLTSSDFGTPGARDLAYDFSGKTLYSAGSGENTVTVSVKTGTVTLHPDVDAGVDVDWFDWSRPWPKVEKATLGLKLASELDLELQIDGNHAWSRSGTTELFTIDKDLEFRLGPLPVGGSLHLDGKLEWLAESSAAGTATAGVSIDTTAYLGGRYEDGVISNDSSFDLDASRLGPTLELDAHAHARGKFIVTGHVDLYGANSVDAEANAWADAEATLDCGNIAWALDVGAGFDAEVAWDILGATGSRDFAPLAWSKEPLASGTLPVYDAVIDPSCGGEGPVPATTTEEDGSASGSGSVGGPDMATASSEEIESSLVSERCDNQQDDDGDDLLDCDDSECADAEACGSVLESWGPLGCGGEISADSGGAMAQNDNEVDAWPINVGNYSGPEVAFTFIAPWTGTVIFAFVDPVPTVLDQDIIVLHSPTGVVDPADAVAWGGNAVEVEVTAGETYIVVVDGYNGASGEFAMQTECGG